MKNKLLTIVAILMLSPMFAQADVILLVDLSVDDTITITGTTGLSAVTQSGSDTTGVYLENFFGSDPVDGLSEILISGDLTSFLNAPDNSPDLFNSSGANGGTGLNIWSWTLEFPSEFQSGVQAFTGSGTWTWSATDHLNALAGAGFGNVYFPADTTDDLDGAVVLGTWALATQAVPEPGSLALLGLGLVGMGFAGRKKA